jgi:hypothetical protein
MRNLGFCAAALVALTVLFGEAFGQPAASAPAVPAASAASQAVPVVAAPAASSDAKLLLELAKLASKSSEPDHLGDLIKIGLPLLGAVAAAIISLIATKRAAETQRQTTLDVTRANQRTELTKELGNRRGQRFDSLMTGIDSFSQKLTSYVTSVQNAIETKGANGYTPTQLAALQKSETSFYGAFLDLVSAESKLLVMGHAELHQQFREFGEAAQAIYSSVHIRNAALTVPQIEEKMVALRKLRLNLLLRMGEAERAWWTQ